MRHPRWYWLFCLIFLLALGVVVARTIATRNFPIDGTYWISLPASPDPPVTNAEQLLAYGPFDSVARYRTETDLLYTWDGAICSPGIDPDSQVGDAPCTTDCFCVIPGEGYQITLSGAPQDWGIDGNDGVTIYPLRGIGPESASGTHLISLPIGGPEGDAADLINNINLASPGVVIGVSRYLTVSDTIQTYSGSFGTNFPLTPGEGYLIQVSGNADYTPLQPGETFPTDPCIQLPVGGTVELPPPGCGYLSPADLHILLDGLPTGTEVFLNASHERFFNVSRTASRAALGGMTETFDSDLRMHITGTGLLGGVDCELTMTPVHVVIDTDPPQLGEPIQDFAADMRSLTGSLSSDTSCNLFESLTVVAGGDNGLPSPGHVRAVERPDGTYDVGSFFNINLRMSFVGKVGGFLEGMSGTTMQTIQMGPVSNIPATGPLPNPSPVRADRLSPGDPSITVLWDLSSCTAQDYNVLYGSLADVSSYTLDGASCGLGTAGQGVWNTVPPGDLWFIVVPEDGNGSEGSWGTDSLGFERSGALPSLECGNATRDNLGSCP